MKTRSITICRIRIAALWLMFVIAANILIFNVVKGQVYSQARDDLLDQARIVTGHISSVVENDINTRIGKDLAQEKLKALTRIGIDQIRPAAACAAAAAIFMLLLIPIVCTIRCIPGEEEKTKTSKVSSRKLTDQLVEKGRVFLSVFGGLANTDKPFFKERWPRDAVKWHEKTPDMKFISATRHILMVVLLVLFFPGGNKGGRIHLVLLPGR